MTGDDLGEHHLLASRLDRTLAPCEPCQLTWGCCEEAEAGQEVAQQLRVQLLQLRGRGQACVEGNALGLLCHGQAEHSCQQLRAGLFAPYTALSLAGGSELAEMRQAWG